MSKFENFKFSLPDLPTQQKKRPKFEPGSYHVEISSAELSASKKEEDWDVLKLVYRGAGGQEANHWVLFPTRSEGIAYGSEKTPGRVFADTVRWVSALGFAVDTEAAVVKSMTKILENLDHLRGLRLEVELGYEGYFGKPVHEEVMHVCDASGSPVIDSETKLPIVVANFDEVEQWCRENGKRKVNGISVLKVLPCNPPNNLSVFNNRKQPKLTASAGF